MQFNKFGHARYCQEQEMLHAFIFKQQILSFTYTSLRNTRSLRSLYTLYFYILTEPFPIREAGFQTAGNTFLKQASLYLWKNICYNSSLFFISLVEFHFLALKDWSYYYFFLISDRYISISVSAALNFLLHSDLERASSIKNSWFPL